MKITFVLYQANSRCAPYNDCNNETIETQILIYLLDIYNTTRVRNTFVGIPNALALRYSYNEFMLTPFDL